MKSELEALVDQMITSGILFEEAVQEFEKNFILSVVNRCQHNLSKASAELGIHRNTLSKRLQLYDNGHRNGLPTKKQNHRQPVTPKRKKRK